jgi:hypothetical protein
MLIVICIQLEVTGISPGFELGPAVLPRHILPLDEAHFSHSLVDRPANQVAEVCRRREDTELADYRHRPLLRVSGERPAKNAAEQ